MSDDGYVYEKDFVMLSVVDTSAPGLYLVEATSKTLLSRADPDEGDDDELEVRSGTSKRTPKSLSGITAATYAPIDTAEELGEAVMTGEKRYLDRFAEASKRSASILAHDYGAEISKQEEEHLSTLAHTLTGEWNPERSLGYSAEMLAKRASELYHAVGFHLGSKYKELVDKVDIALKTAIKEAKTDTSHGMPLLSENQM
ncbi:TPA: hypothetical protein ACH3X1_011772 [Trebouxia sp. C0004]